MLNSLFVRTRRQKKKYCAADGYGYDKPARVSHCLSTSYRLLPLFFGFQPTCDMRREAQQDASDNVFYTAACLFARSSRLVHAYQKCVLRRGGGGGVCVGIRRLARHDGSHSE